MQSISHLLATPLVMSLLLTHPNDVRPATPPSLRSWWEWAASPNTEPRWMSLIRYYNGVVDNEQVLIPEELRCLVDNIRLFQLPRNPVPIPLQVVPADHSSLAGMSPKKIHEVTRMTGYISHLLATNPHLNRVRHVVDIGAGQAYLSRSLSSHLSLHVLALDSNDVQTRGAKRWDGKAERRQRHRNPALNVGGHGSLTHKTILITSETLHLAIDDWIPDTPTSCTETPRPIPIMFVALHACGSLTPHILRSFLVHNLTNNQRAWQPVALVTVGCCYNLMSPQDFPLSATLSSISQSPPLSLPHSALHLATQLPANWLSTPTTLASASLALRKVVWRALLQRAIVSSGCAVSAEDTNENVVLRDGTGTTKLNVRLGRLRDSVYADWATFLRAAKARLGLVELGSDEGEENIWPQPSRADESPLEVLHVLRCLLGPLIESLIIIDRETWMKEELRETNFDVELVNLFDQATGSGRNIAIVVWPRP